MPMANCGCHEPSGLKTDAQVMFKASITPPVMITMTKALHSTDGQAPVAMNRCHCNASRLNYLHSTYRRSQKVCGVPGAAGRTEAAAGTCVRAGPVGEGEELPKPGNAHVYSKNHPFLTNYDQQLNEGVGGAAAFAVAAAGGGGGFSADPDGGQGCCSGLGRAVFCCCGACDSNAEVTCDSCSCWCGGCGDCCLSILQAPFVCMGSVFSCIGDCVGDACSNCTDCLTCCFQACCGCLE